MSLTPSEILHKEFNTKFRGYDPDEVNDFLDLIVVEFDKLTNSNQEMTTKINDLDEKLNYFKQLQDSLNNSIVVAQEAAERLKQNARKEAELILYEAEREADRIVSEANTQSKQIVSETEALQKYSLDFRDRLTNMVEAQLSLLHKSKNQSIFDEAEHLVETPINHLKKRENLEKNDLTGNEEVISEIPDTVDSDLVEKIVTEHSELNEINHDVVMQDDYFDAETTEREISNKQQVGESVLGRTIRIDLPKD